MLSDFFLAHSSFFFLFIFFIHDQRIKEGEKKKIDSTRAFAIDRTRSLSPLLYHLSRFFFPLFSFPFFSLFFSLFSSLFLFVRLFFFFFFSITSKSASGKERRIFSIPINFVAFCHSPEQNIYIYIHIYMYIYINAGCLQVGRATIDLLS